MKKVLVIGCAGSGKSTFARKLSAKTGLPLVYLDMIWHRPDGSNIGREAFLDCLKPIVARDAWILDGNYAASLPYRLSYCDTVFYFDFPTEVCLAGAMARIGKPREDMPWVDKEMDETFRQWILNFNTDEKPKVEASLANCNARVIVFHSREESNHFLTILDNS